MPYKDPNRQREAVRNSMRAARRSAPSLPPSETLAEAATWPLESAQDVCRVLAALTRDLLTRDMDAPLRAKTVAYIAQVQLKAMEVGELEAELAELRTLVEQQAQAESRIGGRA